MFWYNYHPRLFPLPKKKMIVLMWSSLCLISQWRGRRTHKEWINKPQWEKEGIRKRNNKNWAQQKKQKQRELPTCENVSDHECVFLALQFIFGQTQNIKEEWSIMSLQFCQSLLLLSVYLLPQHALTYCELAKSASLVLPFRWERNQERVYCNDSQLESSHHCCNHVLQTQSWQSHNRNTNM